MNECHLCNLYVEKSKVRIENDAFYGFFDQNPITPGHFIIASQQHIENLLDLNEEQWLYLKQALTQGVNEIEKTDKQKLYLDLIANSPEHASVRFWKIMLDQPGIIKKPDGYNFGNNQGEAAGRTIHHLHIHIIPRYMGDVPNPKGGVRNIIPELGDYTK